MSKAIETTKQILVAENDPSALESVAFLLKAAGYSVHKASGTEECEELLRRSIIHAAIVDLRLSDNQHVEDTSGFGVVQQIPNYIPSIIYTAYQNIENLRKALREVGAKDMVNKSSDDASEELLGSVESLFAKHVRVNFELEINGAVSPHEIASKLQMPDDCIIEPDRADVDLILRRLFWDAQSVALEPLFSERGKSSTDKMRAIVLCATPHYEDGGAGAPMVLKFGAATQIKQEEENHGALMRFLGGARLTVLEEVAQSRDVGALCYRLFGPAEPQHTVSHLSDYIQDLSIDPDEIGTMIQQFFDETFAGIYRWAEPKSIDIFSHYAERLALDAEELTSAIHDLIRNDERIMPSVEDDTAYWQPFDNWLPEPSEWLAPNGRWRTLWLETKECLCHGDLHSQNLLVDSTNSLWLIDFERVAQSHWLRDYVELETDIKYRLDSNTTLEEFYVLEQSLFHILDGKPRMQPDAVGKLNPRTKRIYRIISRLRYEARNRFGLEQVPVEYYCALLISTLNVMQLKSTSAQSMEQAYLSASLLCKKIDGL